MSQPSLKKQLKTLKQEKGIQSRKIGDAKKSGEDAEQHIIKIQQIGQSIRIIEAQLKKEKQIITTENKELSTPDSFPPQFSEQPLISHKDTHLNVQLHHDRATWDAYVKSHSNATIYHTWAIKDVIEQSFSHQTLYISVRDENNNLQGVLPLIELKSKLFGHSLISIPFFNYGGMLYSSHEARSKLLELATKHARELNVEHIELRDCRKFDDLPVKEAKVSMLLNLACNKDELWNNFGTKLRAQL